MLGYFDVVLSKALYAKSSDHACDTLKLKISGAIIRTRRKMCNRNTKPYLAAAASAEIYHKSIGAQPERSPFLKSLRRGGPSDGARNAYKKEM